MKKCSLFLISFVMILLFSACGEEYAANNEEMLDIIKKEESLSSDIKELGAMTDGDVVLMVGKTGESPQESRYYAAQFTKTDEESYVFDGSILLNDIGIQIRQCSWQQGYVFICDNSDAAEVRFSISAEGRPKEARTFKIDILPWIYYFDAADYAPAFVFEYDFLDKDGNALE